MTESAAPAPAPDADPATGDGSERAVTPQKRALEAITAIAAGANPTQEAFRLSNEFTDRQTARFWAWLRRLKPRP